jgi:hypothetical protein
MLLMPLLTKSKPTQSTRGIHPQAFEDSQACGSTTEMRQLAADEYSAVAGGPELQVGDGPG